MIENEATPRAAYAGELLLICVYAVRVSSGLGPLSWC